MGMGNEVLLEDPEPPRDTHKLLQVLGGTARRKKLLSPLTKGHGCATNDGSCKGSGFQHIAASKEWWNTSTWLSKTCCFIFVEAAGGCPASLRPGRWLDLYSVTGSVGIEAISRGCSEAHFVEMDPSVISDVLRPNLESTGFLDASVIHAVRVENFLKRAEQFLVIGENTFIVVEYPLRTDMLDSCGCLIKIADRRFGRTHLAIYGPQWAQKKRKSGT